MSEFIGAAFGFPCLVMTTAFAAVIGFWTLVLCRVTAPDAFDADADTEALGLGDTSVATAASAVVATGWVLDICGMVLLGRAGLPGVWALPLSVFLLAGALTLSWRLTKWVFGLRRRASFPRTSPRPGPGRRART
ncbi:hypothetical protein [Streptomyces omiyaensis]|uniref:Uncharacterized protein n=1 Tax=Streptomyces omiyaensis TaxID=68247 RepID=A0ABW7C100_9ACTN|nr:hypothetical protein [Streptomyces omiyaensis]GGY76238.1 hypothetical protein GCM10010363_66560 [Streptomyces omiyaensis]